MSFADDAGWRRQRRFCVEMARCGFFLHPHHNWFLCAAHTEADIDRALAAADGAFALVKADGG